MKVRNEREAHAVIFAGAMRPTSLRFNRSPATAERAISVQHYVSNKTRHRALRFMRRFVQWLLGSKP